MQRAERVDAVSIGLLVVSGFGMVTALMLAAGLGLLGLMNVFGELTPLGETVPLFTVAWIAGLIGLLALPAVILSLLRLLGREPRLPAALNGWRWASILILLWPLALAAGNMVAGSSRLAWLLLPPLHLLAIGLPLWWLVEMARRRLPGGGLRRGWGVLSTALFVTTPTVVIVELLLIVGLVVMVILAIGVRPEWAQGVERLAERIALLQNNPQALLQVMRPLLTSPLVVYGALALLAGLVPMLEELFKPLAVWFLVGRQITPAEGFVAGAISGGGFALLESLMTLSAPQADGWAALAIARAGTGLLHITTTALVGWAMANAWRSGDYLRLALAYLLAVIWHGTWNAISVASGLGAAISNPPAHLTWLMHLASAAPYALMTLVASMLLFLWAGNRRLRAAQPAENAAPETF